VTHLDESAFLDLLAGRDVPGAAVHLGGCPRCRAVLEQWQTMREDLREVSGNGLDQAELHRLGALLRARGPAPSHRRVWFARPVALAAPAELTVRGGLAAPVEHRAGPFHIALQVRPATPRSGAAVHGQVFFDPDQEAEAGGAEHAGPELEGEVLLSDDTGAVVTGAIDDLGELAVRVASAGRYRATLVLASATIVIDELEIS